MNQNIKKEDCLDCKDLPEGEVVQGHDHRVTNLRYKKLNLEAKLIDIDLNIARPADILSNINITLTATADMEFLIRLCEFIEINIPELEGKIL
jgi:hypothetical protein